MRTAFTAFFALLAVLCCVDPASAQATTDVAFANGAVTIKGTIFHAPGAGKHPAIVLLAGSGKQTRDSTAFRILERRFNALGFDVLAFDKRGTGQSGGTFDDGIPLETLAADALAGIHLLQSRNDVDAGRVGVWGVSQGGWLGPLMASMSRDVAFVISISGPGVSIAEQSIFLRGSEMLAKGYTPADVERMTNFRRVLWAYYGTGLGREAAQSAMNVVKGDRWYKDAKLPDTVAMPDELDAGLRAFMRQAAAYDPLQVARSVRVPVLSVFGAKDSIVPAAESLANLIAAYGAGGNTRASFALFPDAGHGIQRVTAERECHDCSFAALKDGTWDAAPGFFELMDDWLKRTVR
jgi:pimeloyl-ACP methyl ester carboxylesterase